MANLKRKLSEAQHTARFTQYGSTVYFNKSIDLKHFISQEFPQNTPIKQALNADQQNNQQTNNPKRTNQAIKTQPLFTQYSAINRSNIENKAATHQSTFNKIKPTNRSRAELRSPLTSCPTRNRACDNLLHSSQSALVILPEAITSMALISSSCTASCKNEIREKQKEEY